MTTRSDPSERLEALLAAHATEIETRALRVTRELEPGWPDGAGAPSAAFEQALRELLRFVFATVPDGCEVYVAARRAAAGPATPGAGTLVVRWQVAGAEAPGSGSGVSTLRPRAGDPRAHAESGRARRVREAWLRTGGDLELEVPDSGIELLARAHWG